MTASLAEAARRGVTLGQAKNELQRLEARTEFACLIFGRECIERGCPPAIAERETLEISRLRAHLEQIAGD